MAVCLQKILFSPLFLIHSYCSSGLFGISARNRNVDNDVYCLLYTLVVPIYIQLHIISINTSWTTQASIFLQTWLMVRKQRLWSETIYISEPDLAKMIILLCLSFSFSRSLSRYLLSHFPDWYISQISAWPGRPDSDSVILLLFTPQKPGISIFFIMLYGSLYSVIVRFSQARIVTCYIWLISPWQILWKVCCSVSAVIVSKVVWSLASGDPSGSWTNYLEQETCIHQWTSRKPESYKQEITSSSNKLFVLISTF